MELSASPNATQLVAVCAISIRAGCQLDAQTARKKKPPEGGFIKSPKGRRWNLWKETYWLVSLRSL